MNKKTSNSDTLPGANQRSIDDIFKTQVNTWEDFGKLQSEFVNLWLECMNEQMQRISTARNMNDICALEAGLTLEYSRKFLENMRKLYAMLLDKQQDCMKYLNAATPESLYSQKPPIKPGKKGKKQGNEIQLDRMG